MSSTTQTIERQDNVFATLTAQGKILKSIYCNNFASLNEIIQLMCANCEKYKGIMQLNIRNQSQGWSSTMSLMLGNAAQRRSSHSTNAPHDGAQYRIPW